MFTRKPLASLLVLASLALAGAAHAEITGVKLTLSPYVGITLWDQLVKLEEKPIYGGRVGLQFGRYIGFEGTYGYSPTQASQFGPADVNVTHYGGDLMINLTKPYRVTPYITGGWAQMLFDPQPSSLGSLGKQSFDGWEVGAGFKADMTDRFHFRIDARDVFFQRDAPLPDNWTHNFIISAGLGLVLFGHVKDTDGDGVSDRKDKCPDTPLGATVDGKGCPTDTDGDGVFDGIDQCSNTVKGARVDAKGCPMDSDGDGVSDGIDQCASTPRGAKVDVKGCPIDGDGDGVADGIDQCANTPTGATVDANGCPLDSDGDGVYDGIDRCPNTGKGLTVDATGCPIEYNEKETQLLDTGMVRLDNVNFASGKTTLTPESIPALDKLGNLLLQWPQLQIEIDGHTDSRGSAESNMKLSEGRAKAVRDYLVTKFPGLNASQYTSKGFGESVPVADNKTAQGQATNRRVELKVLNRETLKKEIDQRKLLKKN